MKINDTWLRNIIGRGQYLCVQKLLAIVFKSVSNNTSKTGQCVQQVPIPQHISKVNVRHRKKWDVYDPQYHASSSGNFIISTVIIGVISTPMCTKESYIMHVL